MNAPRPNFRWIEVTWKRIIVPILDTLDESTRDLTEADLEKIRENPHEPPFTLFDYKGRDLPGGRSVVIADGRFAIVYQVMADHPVIGVKYFLDAERFDATDVPPDGPPAR